MKSVLTIVKRELQAYFTSPIAYVVVAAFLVLTGYIYSVILYQSRLAVLYFILHEMILILLFVAPVLTMRLLAEEQRVGTIELLLTLPVRDWEVVVGKFLASLTLLAVMLAFTLHYPLILEFFGNPERGPILAGYMGLLLFGGALFSIGLFTSSLTENQIVAAVLAVGLNLLLWFSGALGDFTSPPLSVFFSYLSLAYHYPDFAEGVIDTKDVIYYLSVIVVGLFLATRVLGMRRRR